MNIGIPDCCPICGGELKILASEDGVKNLFCVNPDCPSKTNEMVTAFLERIGVMGVSNATVMDWHLHNISDIVNFKAHPSHKSETNFTDELDRKMWCASKKSIFIAMSAFIPGVGRREMEKFYDKHGEHLFEDLYAIASSSYVKETEIIKKLDDIRQNCNLIFNDSRYHAPVEVVSEAKNGENSKGTICFTGKLETMTRSVAQEKARSLGYEIADSVSKTLGTLVVADAGLQGAPSSKLKKAMSFGTKIMSESEFNAL